ncbi:hypothetical protein [Peribacillus sp. NPDC097295]|uniref:hypothetical protein n=1 Tax=Peribacillus sp. NPDC097295 TaxID=3364402 RepID=UPI00382FAD03
MDGVTLYDIFFIVATEVILLATVALTLLWVIRARKEKVHYLLAIIIIVFQLVWNVASSYFMMTAILIPGVSVVLMLSWRLFIRDDYTKSRLFSAALLLQCIWFVLYIIVIITNW